jgi:hypothetical protein
VHTSDAKEINIMLHVCIKVVDLEIVFLFFTRARATKGEDKKVT